MSISELIATGVSHQFDSFLWCLQLIYSPLTAARTNSVFRRISATMAMEAGKSVMCEKPVGADVAELERLQSVAEKAGVVLMPGHNYVYEPPLCADSSPLLDQLLRRVVVQERVVPDWHIDLDRMRTKQMLDDGKLGKITSVYVVYNIYHPEEVRSLLQPQYFGCCSPSHDVYLSMNRDGQCM